MIALFPEKRIIRHGRADWMMRHPVGEATPELEHLRSDAPGVVRASAINNRQGRVR